MEKLKLSNIKSTVGLKEGIFRILESASAKVGVKPLCDSYLAKIDSGVPEEMLYESFVSDMGKYSYINSIEAELQLLGYNVEKDANNIAIKKAVYEMAGTSDAVIGKMIETPVANYLVSKTDESVKDLKESLEIFKTRPGVQKILECVDMDAYIKKFRGNNNVMSLNESAGENVETLYTQSQVDEMINAKINEAMSAKAKEPKLSKMCQLEDRVNLRGTIENILSKEKRNEKVKTLCEGYLNALKAGKSQYALYESFISGLSQYTYLNAVDTELSAMKDRVSKYKQDIDLTKILETMKQTDSYYIVPLIEESIVDYCTNKTPGTKATLKVALDSFSYNPFVRDIISIVNSDCSLDNFYLGESVETNPNAKTVKVYSPVLYVAENETVFNVDGIYYNKKGNSISRVSKGDIVGLNESFRSACDAINSKGTSYDESKEAFKLYSADGNHVAYVNENKVIIDGEEKNYDALVSPQGMTMAAYNGTREFIDRISAIRENMNTVAEIDFVKSVQLYESEKKVDIFKVGKTLHMALINEDNSSEFYKNVNPIKCKNLMNEHMNFNVDMLFEDVMPNQKRLEEEVNDTKSAFENYIETLKSKKEALKTIKEEDSEVNEEDIDKAMKLIDDEIDTATKDYKKYQQDVEDEFKKGSDGKKSDDDKKDDTTEPDGDIKDVEPGDPDKQELSQPITTDANPIPGQENSDDDMTNMATEYDGLLDTPNMTSDGELERGFDIVKVSFDKNIKSGKTSNKGTVIMTVPMVTSNGDVKDEIKSVTFTVDSDKNPIINNDYMPQTMYTAIRNAIMDSKDLANVEFDTVPDVPAEGDVLSQEIPADETPAVSDEPETSDAGLMKPTDEPVVTDITNPVDNMNPIDDMNVEATPDNLDATIENILPDDNITDDDITSAINQTEDEPSDVNRVSFARGENEAYMDTSAFPITVALAYSEITPISREDFRKAMSDHKIETEDCKDDELGEGAVITLKNRADVVFLQKYLEDWLEIKKPAFYNAFPELKAFESFNYKKACKLNESLVLEGSIAVNIDVEGDEMEDMKSALDDEDIKYDENSDGLKLTANNASEFDNICGFLNSYRQELKSSDDLAKELDRILSKTNVDDVTAEVPYDANFVSKMDKEGISYDEDDDNVIVHIESVEDANIVLDTAEDLGLSSNSLAELDDFIADGGFVDDETMDEMNEGLKITVENEKSGTKITFDTDDLEKESDKKDDESDEDEKKDEENGDGDASFGDDTQLYSTPDEAKESNGGEDKKDAEPQQESEQPKKKKFVFKAKKLHEGAEVKYASAHVGDKIFYKGTRGQITDKNLDGTITILVGGHTIVCDPSEVKLAVKRLDLVDAPYKFDPVTQKML